MNYCLRNILEEDKEFIYNFKKTSIYNYIEKIWGWNESFQIKDFESDFNLINFKIIVIHNRDVGFIQIDENQLNVNINEIHIVAEYQGHGIGSRIINNIIYQAINNNKTVTIGCFIDNCHARYLYERLGFKVITTTDTHYKFKYPKERIK